MRRMFIALTVVILWGLCSPCDARQLPLAGEWIGGLDSGRQWLDIKVRFDGEDGVINGTLDLPRFGLTNQRLSQISIESSRVRFEWVRGELGTAVFDGEFRDGGLVGSYRRRDVISSFVLVRVARVAPALYEQYAGSYMLAADRFVHIGQILDFTDSKTGRVGTLHPSSETTFFSGPSAGIPFPVDIRVRFFRDRRGGVTGLEWQEGGARPVFARRLPHRQEQLTFRNGDATLTGTLFTPAVKGRHPAIVFASPGYSLFPKTSSLTYFFVRQGIAVLQLTGRRVGRSPADYNHASFEQRARDVLAGVQTLKPRRDINARQIGLHGSSLGAWVAPLAATISRDVAFLILRAGSALPVTENILYEIENDLREQNFSADEITKAVALRRLLNTTILGNNGWETLRAEIERSRNERWFGYARVGWILSVTTPPDYPTLRGLQDPISYDPIPVLERVTIPVLAINGELDRSVNTRVSVPLMEGALRRADNSDSTFLVLPRASHDLMESQTGYNSEWPYLKRYVPGYLKTMTGWLRRHLDAGR